MLSEKLFEWGGKILPSYPEVGMVLLITAFILILAYFEDIINYIKRAFEN